MNGTAYTAEYGLVLGDTYIACPKQVQVLVLGLHHDVKRIDG